MMTKDSNHAAMQKHLLDWIGSDDGYALLLALASRLLREAEQNRAIAVIWPYPVTGQDDEYRVDEIAHDFYIFLAENFIPQLPENPILVHLLESNNLRKLFAYARRKFLWVWKEKSRSKEHNPAGYLYRRLRETISMAPEFLSGKGVNNAFLFKLKEDGQSKELIQTSLAEESMSSWPVFPESGAIKAEKEIYKQKYLHRVALFFWNEACSKTTVQALAVRDLQRYLLSIHSWLLRPSSIPLADDCTVLSVTNVDMDTRVHTESISLQAEHLVSGWTGEQCAVFLMRLKEPPVKLKKIAEQLRLGDHNAVHRLYTACTHSIITFSSNWPGPPLAELPEECAELFLEQIKICAKNRITVRNKKERP
ncbi:MAG: hypothetical protein U9R57_12380 [Thermodesulfobacteriota bacterium]|nr:hypothetical protein [Thermodesulfobacteriota bacterium]